MGLNPFKRANKTIQPINGDRLLNPRDTIKILGFDGISVFGDVTKQELLKWFSSVPEVFQVLTTDARMFGKMNITVRNKKTGEEVESDNRVLNILNNPNWYQSKKEFLLQDRLFRNIYGEQFIYFQYPFGFDRKSTKQIFPINPYTLELYEPSGGLPPFMRDGYKEGTEYRYTYESGLWKLPLDSVLHLNDANVKDDKPSGVSKLAALKPNIKNIISAYESRGILLRNRGALGILSNRSKDNLGVTLPQESEELKRVQKDYEKYGLTRNQWHTIVTSLPLTWQKMTLSPKELMLFEEIDEDFRKICDAFGFKSEMFSTQNGSTFENAKQYEKSAYQNTIIPAAQEYVNGLNGYFETENESYVIVGEFDNLHVFDEDKTEIATTIQITTSALSEAYTSGGMSLEEYQARTAELWNTQTR